jgi:hypothetical protein
MANNILISTADKGLYQVRLSNGQVAVVEAEDLDHAADILMEMNPYASRHCLPDLSTLKEITFC